MYICLFWIIDVVDIIDDGDSMVNTRGHCHYLRMDDGYTLRIVCPRLFTYRTRLLPLPFCATRSTWMIFWTGNWSAPVTPVYFTVAFAFTRLVYFVPLLLYILPLLPEWILIRCSG